MDKIMPIAMYLPQFHQIPENDLWWGKGFTDWVTVKNAKKIVEGQHQPRIPLHNNYYDLTDKEAMEWQAQLAQQYGGIGFCFYHYYFKDGRKILEKPAQELLRWKDIRQPFCFCWANETWARSWSNVRNKNVWTEIYEGGYDEGQRGILLEQKYGDRKQWGQHIEYLLPFFEDERYIKKDGRPIFLIYKPEEIFCLEEMMALWKEVAAEHGLKGLEIIGVNVSWKVPGIDAILFHGPQAYWNPSVSGVDVNARKSSLLNLYDYQEVWDIALHCQGIPETQTYFGGFVDYDDSPRRGKNGTLLEHVSPEIFEENLGKLVQKNLSSGNGYLFINAWNEWGESMYLEPDSENRYAYLQALQEAIRTAGQTPETAGGLWQGEGRAEDSPQLKKYKNYFRVLERWLTLKEQKKNLSEFLISRGYQEIAIYGWGILGKHLYEELKDTEIKVLYAVDRQKGEESSQVKLILPEEAWKRADAIVVTATFDFANIRQFAKQKTDMEVLSLEELVMEA